MRSSASTDAGRGRTGANIQGSELIVYPDSGHGGIFQFRDRFAPVAVEFLPR